MDRDAPRAAFSADVAHASEWTDMDLISARHLALTLMQRHGLDGWRFAFDHARRRFGSCQPRRKIITLSRALTFLNSEAQVRDTILHEIAHALTPGDGHGRRWETQCVQLGIAPRRCYSDAEVVSPPRPAAPYVIGCERCNWWADRRRRPPRKGRLVCRACRGPVTCRAKVTATDQLRR